VAAPRMARGSLARRFALAAAGLAAGALLMTALGSWWLIQRQQSEALSELAAKEIDYQSAAVARDLEALASRMTEVAGSTILATGLVDSKGRETYLAPFLGGVRQINGIPVQLLFTDFEGKEIASSAGATFSEAELAWLRDALSRARATSTILGSPDGPILVAVEPLVYARTSSPEGALLYKLRVQDLHVRPPMRLVWGQQAPSSGRLVSLASPPVFAPLQLRLHGPEASEAGNLRPQYLFVLAITAIVFFAVVVAGVRFAHVLTRDLRRLQTFSEDVVASGLSSRRAPAAGSAEVVSLAGSINAMLDRLHAQHSALAQESEKLAELAEALRVADRRKDEFLATLAHELRNPLAPIRNSIAVMKLKNLEDPHLLWAREVIDRQVANMARLLDDLLDISRISRNKLELRKSHVALSEVVEAAAETSRPLVEAAGHTLTIDTPQAPIRVDADALRLSQVIANLLNNAAKYTPRGGVIRLSVKAENDHALVSVRDNGIGIAADQLEGIFDMFVQAAAHDEYAHGGLGIGLSLVRALTEMHGGTVSAASEGPGLGSEFTVRLPLAPPEQTPAGESVAEVSR
jgi:signal transduction histidine kinase